MLWRSLVLLLVMSVAAVARATPATWDVPQALSGVRSYTAVRGGDLDGDGKPELLVGYRGSGIEVWSHDTALGTWSMLEDITGFGDWFDIHDLATGDFNHDGRVDIAVSMRFVGTRVILSMGNGVWSNRWVDGTYGDHVQVADLDGDGNLDLFVVVSGGGTKLFYGDGAGNFTPGPGLPGPGPGGGATLVDADHDGRVDIMGASGQLAVYLARNGRSWSLPVLSTFPMYSHSSGAAADFNHDGFIDFVQEDLSSGETREVVAWGGQDGSGNPAWTSNTVVDSYPGAIGQTSVADLDGDGNPDIVVTGQGSFPGIKIYYGDGVGHFSAAEDLATSLTSVWHTDPMDYTGDGRVDIPFSRYSGLASGMFGILASTAPARGADAVVFAYLAPEPRPGRQATYTIVYSNRGDVPITRLRVRDTLPPAFSFVSSTPAPTSHPSARAYVWNFNPLSPPLEPGESRMIQVEVMLPASTPIGTTLRNTCVVSAALPADVNRRNNTFLARTVLTGSYDPNDKVALPVGFIRPDEEITYVIHYENEGTADTFQVLITDTLDPQLDPATLSGISDGGVFDPATRMITWELPVAVAPGGTGFVGFTVRPVAGLAPGSAIPNHASIVFDYNLPMDTPEAVKVVGTDAQLALQEGIRGLVLGIQDVEDQVIDAGLPDLEGYLDLTQASVLDAWQAFDDVQSATAPWHDLGAAQAKLDELLTVLAGDQAAPPEAVAALGDVVAGLVSLYPAEPIADAGPDGIVEATGPTTPVTLVGSGSYNPNPAGGIVGYTWYDDASNPVATGATAVLSLPLGTFTYRLVVSNGSSDSNLVDDGSAHDAFVTVTVRDTTPPQLTVALTPNLLWPADKKMRHISAMVTATDGVDPAPQVKLLSITCNQPSGGDIAGAAHGTADFAFDLRAKRTGASTASRIYTVTYAATDASGNSMTASATVTVPRHHDHHACDHGDDHGSHGDDDHGGHGDDHGGHGDDHGGHGDDHGGHGH